MAVTPALTNETHINTTMAAQVLGCTRQRVLSLAARGLLQPVTIAGRVFFLREQVEELRDTLAAERHQARRPRRKAAR